MSDIPPVDQIKLGQPVNYQGEERYITGVSRDPKDTWVTINGSNDRLKLGEVEWIRECYWSNSGEPAKKVRLW